MPVRFPASAVRVRWSIRRWRAAARARGRTGGQKPKLGPRQIKLARQMYDETGDDGKRKHTVAQIAAEFGVSRPTIYRNLAKHRRPGVASGFAALFVPLFPRAVPRPDAHVRFRPRTPPRLECLVRREPVRPVLHDGALGSAAPCQPVRRKTATLCASRVITLPASTPSPSLTASAVSMVRSQRVPHALSGMVNVSCS